MDERFPKLLRFIVGKLSFLAIPNLGTLIAGLAVLGFIGLHVLGAPMERFIFRPDLVMQGEWWRIFAFPAEGMNNPLWLIFYILYVYFVVNALEQSWGEGPLTVFVIFAYLCALSASFLTGRSVSLWYHVMENVSLAFGTLFPEFELLLFFVLPVKAKWLAWLAGALLLVQFVLGGIGTKIFTVVVMLPYLVFFGPLGVSLIRDTIRRKRNRSRFDGDHWR